MQFVAAYTSLAVTLGLVVTRPKVGTELRVGPAPAAAIGVLIMLLARVVAPADVLGAVWILGRPLVAIVGIMVTTAVAARIGLLDRLAEILFARSRASASGLFLRVFALAGLTAAVLNNDSAVLLLTPAVVALVRARYPHRPRMVLPFVFAVFMAAGVAPLVLSNPMNMIFAAYANIDFNAYAARMVPISLAGFVVAAFTLHRLFRGTLADEGDAEIDDPAHRPPALDRVQVRMLLLLGGVLGACPFVAYAGAPVWAVAVAGGLLALAAVARPARLPLGETLREGISWDIVCFLVLVSVMGVGMRNAGLVGHLTSLYTSGNVAVVGAASAVGSAVLNNHPMSILNMLALEGGSAKRLALAALIGGDLGPRLLPMGSLAGLLWYDQLRRARIEVPLRTFARVGLAITIPTLALSLFLLRAFPV